MPDNDTTTISPYGNAHVLTTSAIASGRLVRQPCEKCGEPKADAHHDDYNKPLAVRWLCRSCHSAWHGANRPTYVRGSRPPRRRGRPSMRPVNRRRNTVSVRFTDAELEALEARAEAAGVPVAGFVHATVCAAIGGAL